MRGWRTSRGWVGLACLTAACLLGGCAARRTGSYGKLHDRLDRLDVLARQIGGEEGKRIEALTRDVRAEVAVLPPDPYGVLLPEAVRIHPLTCADSFDGDEELDGVNARVEAMDRFGHGIKTVGTFRFEMYGLRQGHRDPRGALLGMWEIPVEDEGALTQYWDPVLRLYRFPLLWDKRLETGRRFLLDATLIRPDGRRFSDNKRFQVTPVD